MAYLNNNNAEHAIKQFAYTEKHYWTMKTD
jgi:hypothetical protein